MNKKQHLNPCFGIKQLIYRPESTLRCLVKLKELLKQWTIQKNSVYRRSVAVSRYHHALCCAFSKHFKALRLTILEAKTHSVWKSPYSYQYDSFSVCCGLIWTGHNQTFHTSHIIQRFHCRLLKGCHMVLDDTFIFTELAECQQFSATMNLIIPLYHFRHSFFDYMRNDDNKKKCS